MSTGSPVYVLGWGCLSASGYGPESLVDTPENLPAPSAPSDGSVAGVSSSGVHTIDGFDPSKYLKMRGLRTLSRASRLAVVSAAAALNYPQHLVPEVEAASVVVGTQWGSIEPMVDFVRTAALDGPQNVNPSQFPNVVANVHAGYLGILFGLKGPNVTLCGPSSGLDAVGYAVDLLRLGRADYALAGGVEALGSALLQGLAVEGELDCPPLPGEGSAFLLIGRRELAGLTAQACVASFATATVHQPSDLDRARTQVIEEVLASTQVEPSAVGVTCHTGSIWQASGRFKSSLPPFRNLQSLTGVCRAADGALAAVAAAFQVQRHHCPALVTVFPPAGAQTALLLTPL